MGEQYLTQGGASPGQVGGNLWLSGIFGAELISASYNTVTVQISGTDVAGNPRWGRGRFRPGSNPGWFTSPPKQAALKCLYLVAPRRPRQEMIGPDCK
jgi:hypothetical protein